jgi:serine-type D-Ala-D-Ala carboxypeptidase/endopeptidase (penicillin-binding protein 4)
VNKRPVQSAALVLLVIVLVAAAATGGFALTDHLRGSGQPAAAAPTPSPTPGALASATDAPSPAPTASVTPAEPSAAGVSAAVGALIRAKALGGQVLATVLDASTGQTLYSRHGSMTAAPASTAKVLTAVALLGSFSPTYRIDTSVVDGGSGAVVLVGAGDPTLTGAAPGSAGAYPDAARLSDLAAQLVKDGQHITKIVIDDSAFSGPAISPGWAVGDVPSSYASPITAVMADGGRAQPTAIIRSSEPDLAAGHELAGLLGTPSLPVVVGVAPPHAHRLAVVSSPPMSELVEQMLETSDNVIAGCLARRVAIAKGAPASFVGAAEAVRAVVSSLGVDPGAGLVDGSGLAAGDRLSPSVLAQVFAMIMSDDHPTLHYVIPALPVAAWSGTLESRFVTGSASAAGAGVIRAKTGTLTSVSTLAGVVHDADGRVLVFALMADQVAAGTGPTAAAEAALDRVAAALAGCGCS